MVNRTIEQKKLKMKRRNRQARFSGATSKYMNKVDRGRYQDVTVMGDDIIPSGKNVIVAVGPVSLSKAVINTGRGPDKERMQEYYNRVPDYTQPLPKTLGLTGPLKEIYANYERLVNDNQITRITIVHTHSGKLDLVFSANQWLFIDIDTHRKIIKRSRIYSSRSMAMLMLKQNRITWVEQLPK